jgi:hypothetical protein
MTIIYTSRKTSNFNCLSIIIALLLSMFLSATSANAQMKQATHISMSNVCQGNLAHWDNEQAVLNFNTSSQTLSMISDVYEITAEYLGKESSGFSEDINGMSVSISTKLSIADLDFKTSADNGETFVFNTLVSLNGKEKSLPVRYSFLYAPRVAESNLNGAPLCSFRIDFSISIDPLDFGITVPEGCNEIIIKVQDGLLNKVN